MREPKLAAVALLLTLYAPAQASPPDGLAALHANSEGQLQVVTRPGENRARLIRSDSDLLPAVPGTDRAAKAQAFFSRHGRALGLGRESRLQLQWLRHDPWGATTLAYSQYYGGVPVFGAWARANIDHAGRLRTANGDLVDGLRLSTRATLARQQAGQRALMHIAAQNPAPGLRVVSAQLYIYRARGNSNANGVPVLAWLTEVGNQGDIREFVWVDATSGKVIDQYTGIHTAIERRIYDGGYGAGFLVWSEGDATPFGVLSIDNLIDFSADTYNFFSNLSSGSFLSWDGADGIMHAVNNDPGINCPNASWNGVSINFCDGTSSDDVVGHEWAHAYTESTHALIYRWQSGALNEAYSDLFGETIDLLNLAGSDSQSTPRTVGVCSGFGGSLPPTFEVLSPASIAGDYPAGGAVFNPPAADITAEVVLVSDGVGTSSDGCETIINDLAGKIALIDRGNCNFTDKVLNAQAAGAAGVVIANNQDDSTLTMGGSAPGIVIASVFIGQSDGQLLRSTAGSVVASIAIGGSTENSRRWLMGEDATSFGGAIRDLWEPRCMGDPGKVSDPEYHCNGDIDNGGVHINSGIPNHAFALLVDGGTYNDVTIDAIGLDRAAHIYWRAATHYQGPSSDFADHADATEAACADLVGLSLPALSTEPGGSPASVMITAPDCAQVSAANLAVELRAEPVACNFQLLLDQDPPPLCDSGSPLTLFAEDFETGLPGWVVGKRAIANPATFDGPDWNVTGDLPDGRPGNGAYGPNLVLGNCSTDIEAGVIYLQSPPITIPDDSAEARLAFDHNVMTEANYDGGNLKASINNGPYTLVPASAFTFNAYNGTLLGSGNDNPLAGEPAFHGADEGSLTSLWGQSQVDLGSIASAGDVVRLRFELGMDGCNGLDGWYVDDVHVYSCQLQPDSDADTVADSADNCILVVNPDQRDTDNDGYGNLCDADLNNNGSVEFDDLGLLKLAFFTTPALPGWNPDADFNGDDVINFVDLDLMKSMFFSAPGPSGLHP